MEQFYRALRTIPLRRGPKRIVGGICGGIADRLGWDVTLVRIVVLISFLLPVIGPGAYLVAWLLLPYYDGSILLEKLISQARRP